jgi:hypothetical protein
MDRKQSEPGERDESLIDKVEDALVGDHEDGPAAGADDKDDKGPRPPLKTP